MPKLNVGLWEQLDPQSLQSVKNMLKPNERVEDLSAHEAMDLFLKWHGLINHTNLILDTWQVIQGVYVEDEINDPEMLFEYIRERHSLPDYEHPQYVQFCLDMYRLGFTLQHYDYEGQYFYHGPAVIVKPHLVQAVLNNTAVQVEQDNFGYDYVVYPAVRAK